MTIEDDIIETIRSIKWLSYFRKTGGYSLYTFKSYRLLLNARNNASKIVHKTIQFERITPLVTETAKIRK